VLRPKTIIRVTRAPFFASLALSVCVGTAIAWHEGFFHWGYFLLTLVGIICANAGLNMSNDYFDHLSGNDEANQELTPFSGGSRTIQEGILSARRVLMWSLFFYLITIVIGLYLAWVRGEAVLWLGVAGIFVGVFSCAPPFRLTYTGHGLGELATFLGSGPLIVLGSYYVQSQRLTTEALWASIPVGLLGAGLIWINEFPDYKADRAVGKSTLVVVLAPRRAVWGYIVLLAAIYGVLLGGVVLSILPYTLLFVLLTLPLAYKAIRGVMRFHSDIPKLIPTNAATIQLYVANAFLMCLGYAIARFL
jgi:1,4-dihydroxy-2-naphthoate octaprenyltransferase